MKKIFKVFLVALALIAGSGNTWAQIRALAADPLDAVVSINGEETSYEWNDALVAANAATGNIVLTLTKDVTAATSVLSNAMAINLNGYNLNSTLTIANGADVALNYSKYGGEITGALVVNGTLNADGGKVANVTINSGANFNENGLTITNMLSNSGTVTITDGEIQAISNSGTLTTQGGHVAGNLDVTAGTVVIKRCTIDGNVSISGGNVTTEKLAIFNGNLAVTGGSATINCGKFVSTSSLQGTYTLNSAFFKTVEPAYIVPANKEIWNVAAGVEAQQGYTSFVGDLAAATQSGVSICTIGTTSYSKLEDALAFANNNVNMPVTIIMQNNYTLPAGYYTLPAKATLVIPMAADQQTGYELIPRVSNNSLTEVDYVQPTEFRRLTLAGGVQLDVFGTIETSCTQLASDESYAAGPHGPYGRMELAEGAHITMQNGSELRAWGYVTGKGEIDVRRGATVREQFQMGDWKGGSTSLGMLMNGRGVFPLTTYFIQNVECMTKYHPGGVLSSTTSVSANFQGLSITAHANDIKIIGVTGVDDAMFLMDNEADAENTWVRKWYDAEHDIQTYDVNSGAHIGSMVLDLGKLGTDDLVMNSGDFVLPITTNMKIHLLSGMMDFTQNTAMLPGSEVEIDKESTVTITYDENIPHTGSLYLYDAADWGKWVYSREGNVIKQNKAVTVRYAPAYNGKPNVRDLENLPSAKINVHGTFDSQWGWVFTSEHGANIFSTNEDAGTFRFGEDAADENYTETAEQVRGTNIYESLDFTAAKLTNGDASKVSIAGMSAGTSLCYMDNRWTLLVTEDCFVKDEISSTYYIKPQNYVQITSNIEDANHLYHATEGSHDYILMAGCQWWEVEEVGDILYHCLHPQNDTYYYWDSENETWAEKRFVITWKNWNGDEIKSYDANGDEIKYAVPYGTMAEYLGTNPTREENVDYTYDFTGWQPALGPVTGDVTYTATYEAKPRMYTIIFQQEGGKEIERQFLRRDEMPVCENEPTKVGHILKWQPALAAVTGDATYTATWLEEKPATWNIKFVNYDGTPVGEADGYDVAAGTMPTAPATPVKPATDEFTYNFTGWKPALELATRDLTYTAQFEEVATKYTIRFEDENGDEIETKEYAYGATPVCINTPIRDGYELSWNPQIQTVMGDATYTAKWKANIVYEPEVGPWTIEWYNDNGDLLQQTVVANNTAASDVQASFTNTTALTKPATSEYTYEFDGWTPTITAATANAVYTAVYREIPIIGPEPETFNVKFTDDGYASFCWDKNWTAPAGVTVYKATSKEGDMIFIEEVNGVIPAEKGVILKGSGAQVTVTATEDEATSLTGNILKGTTVPTPNPAYNNASVTVYAMHRVGGTTVFDSYEGETIPANKAYIRLGAGAPARLRVVMAGNTTTGMENAATLNSGATKRLINGQLFILRDGKMYNVQGIKL